MREYCARADVLAIAAGVFCLQAAAAETGKSPDPPTPIDRVVVVGARQGADGAGLLLGRAIGPDSPVSLEVITASDLSVPGTQSIASILSRIPSIGENYATTGYYENFTVRGFTADLGTAYRINGFIVPGEFHIPLETVSAVEVLQGIGGLQGGQVGAGGTINFVTRRLSEPNVGRVEATGRGGGLVSADMVLPFREARDSGLRISLTGAEMRPSQPASDGRRRLATLALDLQPLRGVSLAVDVMAQHRSQPAVPGFQLLGGTVLPDLRYRDVNINRQPWSRPVTNDGVMASARLVWQLTDGVTGQVGGASTVARIDDNLATPWGCNRAPVQYFCPDGDFVLYRYHANERRQGDHVVASVSIVADSSAASNRLTMALERVGRSVRQDGLYSVTTYDDSGNGLTQNIATTERPLAPPSGTGTYMPVASQRQYAVSLGDRMTVGSLDAHVGIRAVRIDQSPVGFSQQHMLPQWAISWNYAGSKFIHLSGAQGVEFGSQAPLTAANAGSLLEPRRTRQLELGWKGRALNNAAWAVTAFRMSRPYEFTQPAGTSWAGLGDYVRGGIQVHDGLEASYHADRARVFWFDASATYLRATASGTGWPDLDGVQIQNVPRLSTFLRATRKSAEVPGLEYGLSWTHKGTRNARRDGRVSVPAYDVLEFGASWTSRLREGSAVFAVNVQNLTDRRYWRDVGEAYSADLLFPGGPRLIAVSARYEY